MKHALTFVLRLGCVLDFFNEFTYITYYDSRLTGGAVGLAKSQPPLVSSVYSECTNYLGAQPICVLFNTFNDWGLSVGTFVLE